MAYFDFPLEQLQTYRPERSEPVDFDSFWQDTLSAARAYPLDARFEPADFGLETVETLDVTFRGFGGQEIKGWLILPRQRSGRLPCVVEYIGYGGGRGSPLHWLAFASAGMAHLVMDTRGQGSIWLNGDTPDPEPDGSNPQAPGFMTRGVLSPQTYYYRRVFTDAVRALEAARAHPAVNPDKIAVTGGSQGGGISLAAAGLDPSITACLPDVPFLCHFRRSATLVDSEPYAEIGRFLKTHRGKVDAVFNTLNYFDGMHFSARAKVPALFSTALMDTICPPSSVYAAYNHYSGPKDIRLYEFNNHEGGGEDHLVEKVRYLKKIFA